MTCNEFLFIMKISYSFLFLYIYYLFRRWFFLKNLQQSFNSFMKDFENLSVYEIEEENYIKLDDFMKVWQKFVGRN